MRPLLGSELIRDCEVALQAQTQTPLMQLAADAAFNWIHAQRAATTTPCYRVAVIAGPGNNGGDAILLAAQLLAAHFGVTLWAPWDAEDSPRATQRSGAVKAALASLERHGAAVYARPDLANCPSEGFSLLVDGVLGIGLNRAPDATACQCIEAIHAWAQVHASRVLALDVPSGLCADTGRVLSHAVIACDTITYIADKPGLHTGAGRHHAGRVHVARLGAESIATPITAMLYDAPDQAVLTRLRRHASAHKGTQGSVAVVGGARGMVGAALLCGRAAARLGAGKTYAVLGDERIAVDPSYPEIMISHASSDLPLRLDALIVGPGLGQDNLAKARLADCLAMPIPLVIDADALNLLAADSTMIDSLANRSIPAVLTPHPLEAARLLAVSVEEVGADRLGAARHIAAKLSSVVVLKGSGTVIASPDGGAPWIIASGNSALASGGSGDVLAGILGACLARGRGETLVELLPLVGLGVWLHGAAADAYVDAMGGLEGLVASDIATWAARVLNGVLVLRR
jgi:ADP-dependent NAD(P)H-hydrate dehydratase / NAD(P)H-hydrate epimerase